MILSQARKLKVGDKIYHRHIQGGTAIVLGLVKEWGAGLDKRWSILIQNSDENMPHNLSGKYAFNFSVTPISGDHAQTDRAEHGTTENTYEK